jgi:hypothetical protein
MRRFSAARSTPRQEGCDVGRRSIHDFGATKNPPPRLRKIDLDPFFRLAYSPAHRCPGWLPAGFDAADLRLTQIGNLVWPRGESAPGACFGHVSADRGAGRRHGGWRNASSSAWLLADRARKDALLLTDQSLPEIDESLAPLGLVGSGGLFFARKPDAQARDSHDSPRRPYPSLARRAYYFAGTAIMSSVVVLSLIPTPRTIAFEAAGGRLGS